MSVEPQSLTDDVEFHIKFTDKGMPTEKNNEKIQRFKTELWRAIISDETFEKMLIERGLYDKSTQIIDNNVNCIVLHTLEVLFSFPAPTVESAS